ncbi:MAG: beta-ketoacyl-[acyl-carrier-protein] synthase family protein [Gammaproteobacteria bacterium]|nr:beta-ketoacyl-[acyl-carrier-protein] synthase family protein [Gammaproteobacteria bacterium]MBT8134245.1 beta-ketoacyl-[acyl-carrier-protein] synthase family protein [Gammaproteobacteria bacterium]NNJ49772.1 beta-ketoacyl-[acyl-carrier-protein] synthase family protein [Gammaproteobacteria bacterium]
MNNHRVVITGLGAISGLGLDTASFWEALKAGRSGIRKLGPEIEEGVKISLGATVPEFDPDSYFSEEELSILDRHSQLAVIAAQEAVEDAGLIKNHVVLQDAAAIIGTGCGGKHTDEATYEQLYKKQSSRAHPLTIPKGMPSAAASMVSLHLGIKGPAFVLASACASGSHSIIQGMTMIQSGMIDVALVGASDAPFTYGLLKSWDALRVASSDTCRPFCEDRSGLVLGEGAGIMVLESEQHARKRGARIYAELAGCGMTSDAGHITRPDISGITTAMKNALNHAELAPEDVDYINAHGTGTLVNDATETEAINRVFDDHAKELAVSSTKSMHGHALGASSALELIATILAIYHDIIPPTANFTKADKLCDLDYVPNKSRHSKVNVAISNSFAFGGLNAVIALKKYKRDEG